MEKLGSCPRIVLIKSADRAPNSDDLKDLLQPQPSVELFFKGNKNRLLTNPRLNNNNIIIIIIPNNKSAIKLLDELDGSFRIRHAPTGYKSMKLCNYIFCEC